MDLLLRNVSALVCGDAAGTVLRDVDVRVRGGLIDSIGPDLAPFPDGGPVIDATGHFVYPGLVNTHHHFFQAFVRNRADLGWPMEVLDWIRRIYPLFARLTEPCFYHSTLVSLAELVKHGCTTAFDHQYCFPRHAGSRIVDQQFAAAERLGVRLHVGRGANTLPEDEGGSVPDVLVESTDVFLADCTRLIDTYHQRGPQAMWQVTVAPCQPANCREETFLLARDLARDRAVTLHTHLGEGECPVMAARWGQRTLAWCEARDLVGGDVWYAHGWELDADEVKTLAGTGSGVSHCPAPVCLVGERVTDVAAMLNAGVRVGLGVDGQASNDGSNLLESLRLAYLLQCLVARRRGHVPPRGADYLRLACSGSAALLDRPELGELAVGRPADLFAVDVRRLEYAGTEHDPLSLPAKVGVSGPVDLTVVNGRVVWAKGEFPGEDENQMTEQARTVWRGVFGRDKE